MNKENEIEFTLPTEGRETKERFFSSVEAILDAHQNGLGLKSKTSRIS